MSISFRSTEEILNYIDEVCTRFSLGVKEHFKHIAYRNGGGHIGILPLIKRIKSEKPENTWQLPEYNDTTYNPKKVTAVQIADEISKWLNEKRILYGHLRLIEPKDIMILVKKRSEFIEYLISELKKRDIPVLDYEKSNLNNSLIIKDMLSLIKFINLPSDEYNLACLLKSSLIGISEESLFILSFQRDKLLWEELQIKEPDIYNYLNLLIEESKSLSPYQLFHKVLYRDKKYTNLLQRFGDKTKSIIEQFLFAALEFESSQVILNLHEEFYEWFKNNELSFSNTSNENKVKILTIHGAKGLQAPIIFLADAASSEQTPFENIFWDEKGNFFFSSYNEFDSQETKYVKETHKLKQKEENLRLLYVALSRAEDEIYICGWDNNRINGSWYDILSKIDLPPIKDPLYQSTAITSKQHEVYIEINTSHPIKLIKKRNITPSQIKASKIHQTFMKRGIVIHKLLHDLPKLQKTKWSKVLSEYDLNITTEVLQTLEKFPHIIFAENSVSEFPITGIVDNQKVNAQIDKVIFHSNLIEIIDFKTNTEPSLKAAQTYTVQLDMYKSLLQQVYPGVKIKAYILFTLNQELIEIIN
jgi:ATP-dependent helicase/nuclease subunit A